MLLTSVLQHVLQTYVETQLEAKTYSVTPRESENPREGLFKNKQYVAGGKVEPLLSWEWKSIVFFHSNAHWQWLYEHCKFIRDREEERKVLGKFSVCAETFWTENWVLFYYLWIYLLILLDAVWQSFSRSFSVFTLYFLVLKLWNNRGLSGGKIQSKYLDKMPQRQKSGLKVSRLKRRQRKKKIGS